MQTLLDQSTSLLPARVLQADGARLKLELPDEHAWALSALAFPYQAQADDIVLAIGRSGAWYVIGVLSGRGQTVLTVPGDLELRSPRGRIALTAAAGVEIRGEEVAIEAQRLSLRAKSVRERFGEVTRWVKDVFQLQVGRLRARVIGTYDLNAERIVERATRDVRVDGEKIYLG